MWDKLTACTSYWHKEGPKPCLSFLSCAWAFNHVPLDSERVHIQLVGVLCPFLHTSKSAAQPLCPDWKGKSSFPGYFHGKLKAFSMTFFPKGNPITSPFRIPEHLSHLKLGTHSHLPAHCYLSLFGQKLETVKLVTLYLFRNLMTWAGIYMITFIK